MPKTTGSGTTSHQPGQAPSRGCRCRALPQDILCLDKDADGASCNCSARPYGKNKVSVTAAGRGQPAVSGRGRAGVRP